jgi:hypothetical protein
MLLYYRGRTVSLLWRWRRSDRDGHGDLDHPRGRRVESLDDPVDGKMGKDDHHQGPDGHREHVLEFHLFRCHLLCRKNKPQMATTNPMFAEEVARIDAVYRVINGNINWDNLVPTVLEAARELEAMPGLKGSEKLDILQKALKHALKTSDKTTVEKEQILHTIESVVPVVMQAAMMASKSPIVGAAMAQVESVCVGCWTKKV